MRGWRGLLLAALALVGCGEVARMADRLGNVRATAPPYTVSAAAATLHARLMVVDLHADTLLAPRDLRGGSGAGHVDLARLRAGGVGIQVLGIVTQMPLCPARQGCGGQPDLVALLAALQGWPAATWLSPHAPALHQAARARAVAADSAAGLALLRTREDLAALLATPAHARPIGAVLAAEGAQAIEGDLAKLDALADAGVRILGLAHFTDTEVAGSAHGTARGGLTPFGRAVLERARARGLIIDLAHASAATVAEVLGLEARPPVLLSHTGLAAVCPVPRNLDDATLRRLVAAEGLVGIGAWGAVLCLGHDADARAHAAAMARQIRHAIAVAEEVRPGHGADHVALGSDFDGWVRTGFDAAGWPLLTEALLREGLAEPAILAVMGGNACRFLLRHLPGAGPPPAPALCDGPGAAPPPQALPPR